MIKVNMLWDALGWAVLHSLWQGALIGAIVWAVRTLASDRQAGVRYLSGIAGLVATFAAFLGTFIYLTMRGIGASAPQSLSGTETLVIDTTAQQTVTLSVLPTLTPLQGGGIDLAAALVPWLGMIWAVGFAFLGLQAWRAYASTRFLANQGLSDVDTDWSLRFERLLSLSRASKRVRLYVSEHVSGPLTLGALKPIVLVPAGFLTALPPAQVEAILLHELAHIRRHDFLLGLVQTAIRTVLYFNPAVILMSRLVDEDREKACDDFAVRLTGRPGDLARGLATLRLSAQAPNLAMAADGGPLMARLNRLMGRPVSRPASYRLSAAALSALMLGTAACSTVSMAHPHPDKPEAPEVSDAELADTVVRGTQSPVYLADTHAVVPSVPQPPVIVVHAEALPPMPEMPVMPAMPEIPAIAAMPTPPVPAYGDYASDDAFEDAMDDWSERMDAWGDNFEARYETEFEAKMDIWEEDMEGWEDRMEAWGEAVEDIAEVHGERLAELEGLKGLEGLDGLEGLAALEALSELGALQDMDISTVLASAADSKTTEQVRQDVLAAVERSIRHSTDLRRQSERIERQVEHAERQAERAERQIEQKVERQIERVERVERQREDAVREAEKSIREREHAIRKAEAKARAHRTAKSHSTRSSSNHTITISGEEKGQTVKINGRTLNVDDIRSDLRAALSRDGLIDGNEKTVQLELCDDSLHVNGKHASKAQARAYAVRLNAAGINTNSSVSIKMKTDMFRVKMAGDAKSSERVTTVGTFNHDTDK